ncbi:MAG: acyltransferase [Patescibacteria group bacterium]|nr:acyltransferase [Patescibacteria group bacterium]MCL5431599.1 acyltransferase [Patescibacteria group bacterium]
MKFIFPAKTPYFIHKTVIISDRNFLHVGKSAEIWEYVIIRSFSKVTIGSFSQIGPFSVFFSGDGIFIGDNVMIGPHCVLAAGNHNYKQLKAPMRFGGGISKGPIIVEDGVWIGANCTITDGVTIGHDSVVAANSVVTRNVKPFDIVAGIPAKKISNRKNK